LLTDHGDVLAVHEVPDVDLLVPGPPGRYLAIRGQLVSMRVAHTERWSERLIPPGHRVVTGTALFDGSAFALLVQHRGADQTADPPHKLLVVGARDGRVLYRFTIQGARSVAFAPPRGLAVLLTHDRHLTVLDLRFGRAVREYDHPHPVHDVAIDPTGENLVMQIDDSAGPLVVLRYRELASSLSSPVVELAPQERPRDAVPEDLPASEAPLVAAAPDASAPTDEPPLRIHEILALGPRPATPIDPELARRLLDLERDRIQALSYLAIARGWDTGRLAFSSSDEHPNETEVVGLLGRQRGRAGRRLAEAELSVAETLAARQRALASLDGIVTPIGELRREFGLDALAIDILLVLAAPMVWGEIARLYGIIANDAERPLCDELLVRQVLHDVSAHDVAIRLAPHGPLVESGVIRVGAGSTRPFLSLAVDPLVIMRLCAEDLTIDPAGQIDVLPPPTRGLAELELPVEVKRQLEQEMTQAPERPMRIVVRGRRGSGRRTLLSALAAGAGRRAALIDAGPLIRAGKLRGEALLEQLQRAALAGWFPVIDGLDYISADDRLSRDVVKEALRRHRGPLGLRLGADVTPAADPGFLQIDLTPLSEHRRAIVWERELLAARLPAQRADEIAARWAVGPGVIRRCAESVGRSSNQVRDPHASVATRIDAAVRQHLDAQIGAIAARVHRLARWSDVILPPDVLDSLLEFVARVKYRRTVYEDWGFDRLMSTSRGLSALFQGGPGTGKTMVAGALANELNLELYRVDVSRVTSKWIGETERNLAQLFDAAEDSQAIILFDEADSLFARRTEVKSSVDRYANLEVNYLLQRLDSFTGIAILTTNFGGSIDAAFKRRLSFRLTFPFPDEEMRVQLWRAHLPPELPRADDVDVEELSRRYQLSGGYIRNVALRSAFLAAAEQSRLRHEHIERAIKLEYREIGRLEGSGTLE
jgi:cytidylate kinase